MIPEINVSGTATVQRSAPASGSGDAYAAIQQQFLGGGGMASLRIDPQGKAYAQQLLEVTIFVPQHIANQVLV